MIEQEYLKDVATQFRKYKKLAEDAIAQLTEEELLVRLDPESNSIAVIMKHMAGNLRSRFTDFLTTDGEKADRNRDAEFEDDDAQGKAAVLERWGHGWSVLFHALDSLRPQDLQRQVTIRGEGLSVLEALDRQMTHHAYHVGQIVFVAKHLRSAGWKSLSIPRLRSRD